MADMGNFSLSDLAAVTNKDGMFGGGAGSWLVMLLIFFLFFRNGNGFSNDFGTVPTQAATQDSVRNVLSNIETSKILEAVQGNSAAISQLAQSTGIGFSEMQNALGNVRTTIIETANATNLSVKDVQTQIALGNSNVISALQNCCCQMQTRIGDSISNLSTQMLNGFDAQNVAFLNGVNSIDKTLCDIRYANEKNTSAIIASGTANTERILDYLNQTKLDELNRELSLARAEISQKDQTAAIVAQLKGSCGCNTCSCGCNG